MGFPSGTKIVSLFHARDMMNVTFFSLRSNILKSTWYMFKTNKGGTDAKCGVIQT